MSTFDDDDDFFADIYDGSNEPPKSDVKDEKEERTDSSSIVQNDLPVERNETQVQANSNENITLDSVKFEPEFLQGLQVTENDAEAGNNPKRDGSATNTGQIYIPPKDEGKMFVGGLNWETTDESLRNYFSKFGELVDCTVMRDNMTGRSRGFGFLTFADPKCVNDVISTEHFLDGRIIDPKRAIPREEQDKTAKIFVGGVGLDVTEDDFNSFFSQYGTVIDAQLMIDTKTGKPRGFGFITFDSHEAVEKIVSEPVLILKGKMIEVKKAEPRSKDQNGNFIPNSHAQSNVQTDSNNRFNNYNNYMGYSMNGMNSASMPSMGGTMSNSGVNASTSGMNPAMALQYYRNWQQYFDQAETVLINQGAQSSPTGIQQLQNIKAMKQNLLSQMEAFGLNPNMLNSSSDSSQTPENAQSLLSDTKYSTQNGPGFESLGESSGKLSGENKAPFGSGNEPHESKGKAVKGVYNAPNGTDNETNRYHPRAPKGFNQQPYNSSQNESKHYNGKNSAAITLVQGEGNNYSDISSSKPENYSNNAELNHRDRDRERDRENDSVNSKYNRNRYPREQVREKRHRSRYENEEEGGDNEDERESGDKSKLSSHSHRSSRDKSHKSRDMSLGARIREDSREGPSRKRHRGEDDRDTSSSRHHRSSSRDKDHRPSRHKESSSGSKHHRSSRRSKENRGGDDSNNANRKDSKEKESKEAKDRRSKSPPLNAPTGPRGTSGTSSSRSGSGKGYSRRYRSNRQYNRS